MDFKKWLLKQEVGDVYGISPPRTRPDKEIEDSLKKGGGGALPTYTDEPLPGNKRAMKRNSKKR